MCFFLCALSARFPRKLRPVYREIRAELFYDVHNCWWMERKIAVSDTTPCVYDRLAFNKRLSRWTSLRQIGDANAEESNVSQWSLIRSSIDRLSLSADGNSLWRGDVRRAKRNHGEISIECRSASTRASDQQAPSHFIARALITSSGGRRIYLRARTYKLAFHFDFHRAEAIVAVNAVHAFETAANEYTICTRGRNKLIKAFPRLIPTS